MNLLTVIPTAFVMIAGPQILSAIFLATSEKWRRNSAAFVFGAFLSITLFVALAYFLGDAAGDDGGSDTISWILLVLLLAAMLRTYVKRGVRATAVDGQADDREHRALVRPRVRPAGVLP